MVGWSQGRKSQKKGIVQQSCSFDGVQEAQHGNSAAEKGTADQIQDPRSHFQDPLRYKQIRFHQFPPCGFYSQSS